MVPEPPSGIEKPASRRWIGLVAAAAGVVVASVVFFAQTAPRDSAFEWRATTGPPPPVNLDSFTEIDSGVAVLSGVTGDGVTLWWSEDTSTWARQVLDGSPSQLATAGTRLVAYRVKSGYLLELRAAKWVTVGEVSFPEEVRTRQASGRASVVGGEDWLLEMSLFGNLWWRTDGTDFTLALADPNWGPGVEQPFTSACAPPSRSSPDVPPVVTGQLGLLALVSSNPTEPFGVWPVCEPVVWTSGDGQAWGSTSARLGSDGSYAYDVDDRDGTFLAVGGEGIGEPVVWSSEDGITWDPVDAEFGSVDVFSVDGGAAGWAILGRDIETSASVGWTSVDGRCWEPIPPIAGGTDVVVTDDFVVVVDRRAFPTMWLGEPTGSKGICR